jgi:hypothetical protein
MTPIIPLHIFGNLIDLLKIPQDIWKKIILFYKLFTNHNILDKQICLTNDRYNDILKRVSLLHIYNRVIRLKHIAERLRGIEKLEDVESNYVFNEEFKDHFQEMAEKIDATMHKTTCLPTDIIKIIVSYNTERSKIQMKIDMLMKVLTYLLNYWLSKETGDILNVYHTERSQSHYDLTYVNLKDKRYINIHRKYLMLLRQDREPQDLYLIDYNS